MNLKGGFEKIIMKSKDSHKLQSSLETYSLKDHPPCTVDDHVGSMFCPKCVRCIRFGQWEEKECYHPESQVPICPLLYKTGRWSNDFKKWLTYGRREIRKRAVLIRLRETAIK